MYLYNRTVCALCDCHNKVCSVHSVTMHVLAMHAKCSYSYVPIYIAAGTIATYMYSIQCHYSYSTYMYTVSLYVVTYMYAVLL